MTPFKLLNPVYTLDRKELLSAGAVLSEETLDELISSNRDTSSPLYSLLKHGSVKHNCLEFMSHHPYHEIFAVHEQYAAVLNLMEAAHVHPAILESLDYFKKHDFDTYRHILMVSALSSLLAQNLMLDSQDVLKEFMRCPNHDLGKICVPIHILKKTDPLTRKERLMLEHHAPAGFVILSYYLRDSRNIASIVDRDHHERKDGSGYPMGTLLADRMVEIVAVSDVYDALIVPRPYRPTPYDNRTALEEITEQAKQGKIGWEVVQALVAYNRKSKSYYRDCTVSLEKRGVPPADNLYGILAPEDACPEK